MQKIFANKKQLWVFTGIIVLSLLIRVIGFYWGGEGTTFHPDEGKVYKDAIKMARNNTVFSSSTVYPAQFTQKILFVFYSVYFKISKFKEVEYSEVVCIYIARIITAVFGTGTVVASYFVSERLKQRAGLVGAIIVGFCGPLVQQAHCSVMDTEVGCCFAITLLLSQIYYSSTTRKRRLLALLGMSLVCSVATMEKWYGAIITLVIAGIVILKNRGSILNIVKQGTFAVGIYILGMFLIAPNLFVFYDETIRGLNHVVNDYESSASSIASMVEMTSWLVTYMGLFSLLFLVYGIRDLLKNKKCEALILLVGLAETFYMTLSGQGAHLRWMQPLFISYSILVAVGVMSAFEEKKTDIKLKKYILSSVIFVSITNIVGNGLLSFTIYGASDSDTSNVTWQYLIENNIKPENCIYDRYTCIRPAGYSLYYDSVDVDDSFKEYNGENYVTRLGRDYALSKDHDFSGDYIMPVAQFEADYYVNKMTNTKYASPSWKWLDIFSIPESLYYSLGFWTGRLTQGFNYYLSDISQIKGMQYLSYKDMKIENDEGKVTLSAIKKGRYIFESEGEIGDITVILKDIKGNEIGQSVENRNSLDFEIDNDYENIELLLKGEGIQQFSGYIIEQ